MDKMIEVRYAGAVVGRSAVVRDVDPQGLFLGVTEPMPVGTELVLKVGDGAVPVKVAAVSESPEPARAGMRVQFLDADEAALFGMALSSAVAAPLPAAGSASVPTAVMPPPSGAVAAAGGPVASGGVAAKDEGEAEAGSRSAAHTSSSGGDGATAPREPESSGPVSSGDGSGAGGGAAAGGGGSRKNRRNRRR